MCSEEYLPTNRGFDSFFGQLTERSDHYTRLLDHNEYIGSGYDLWANTTVSYEGAGLYSAELWAREAGEKIEELETSDKPWLLQVSFTSSSPSYQAPDSFMELYDNQTSYSKEEFEEKVVRRAMVSAMDKAVGDIISKLRESKDWENTVVIFLSDNGSSVKEGNLPFRGGRGSPLEGGVRVPALVVSPLLREEARGSRLTEMVHMTDILPTILHLAGHVVAVKILRNINKSFLSLPLPGLVDD